MEISGSVAFFHGTAEFRYAGKTAANKELEMSTSWTGSVTTDQVSLAFNNNDEMKASYVGTSDQGNLSRTHVDSCQGPA